MFNPSNISSSVLEAELSELTHEDSVVADGKAKAGELLAHLEDSQELVPLTFLA